MASVPPFSASVVLCESVRRPPTVQLQLKRLSTSARRLHGMKHFDDLKSIYTAAVEFVKPAPLVRRWLTLKDNTLAVGEKRYHLTKPCHVVGFGKAVGGMALELERILGERLAGGVVAVPDGSLGSRTCKKIEFVEAAKDNLPDERSVVAARKIKEVCEQLDDEDLLLVLISGGGSALLCSPRGGVTLQAKVDLIRELVRNGADIEELNIVRGWLSDLKGGGLASAAYPAGVISLLLSDVVGDKLEVIASGPTVPNQYTKDDFMKVLHKYNVAIKGQPWEHLQSKSTTNFGNVDNLVIGNNEVACKAAQARAKTLGYSTTVLSTIVTGDVKDVAESYVELASKVCAKHPSLPDNVAKLNPPCCLIAGGETTVVLGGEGKGGRNQHLALAFSTEMTKVKTPGYDVTFLSCGTDGIDGPTDAAGALGYGKIIEEAKVEGLDTAAFLQNNDSYTFYSQFANGDCLVKTGHSGTNVMDLHLLLVTPKQDGA